MLVVTTGKAKSFAHDVFRRLAKAVDSPFSRECLELTDKQLSEVALDPALYQNASDFSKDYLVASMLSKYAALETNVDTKSKALRSFEESEVACHATNSRLRRRLPAIVDPVIHRASRLIANLLGPFPERLDHASGRWSPGATFEFPRAAAYLDTKVSKTPFTVTREAAPFFLQVLSDDLHWAALLKERNPGKSLPELLEVVEGSRVSTVPKNAKTDRTICIEPRGNMFLQKAVGSFFRSRLKRVGVDLDNQALNQACAFEANLQRLATLDLKSASDSISVEIVYELLPLDWAYYLDCIRSKNYTMDGKTFQRFNKFSSMGNGFTFELESLIFWALTAAVCEDIKPKPNRQENARVCSVYGDDIIVPQEFAHELTCVLNWCGFDINLSKSFYGGNFYESCGRHYFDSVDVTPIYQKKVIASEFEGIRLHNRLRRWQQRNRHVHDPAFHNRLDKVLDYVFRRTCDFPSGVPVIPAFADGDQGFLLYPADYRRYNVDVSQYCPNRGQRLKVRTVRKHTIPCDEAAHYTYKLRELHDPSARLKAASTNVLHLVRDAQEFDGNVENRVQKVTTKNHSVWKWFWA